jgi:hypothetical protein
MYLLSLCACNVLTVKSQLFIIMEYLNAGNLSKLINRLRNDNKTRNEIQAKILEELYLNFRSYDFLKKFSYNGPYGRKLIFKN